MFRIRIIAKNGFADLSGVFLVEDLKITNDLKFGKVLEVYEVGNDFFIPLEDIESLEFWEA